jgi:hypothetical protein
VEGSYRHQRDELASARLLVGEARAYVEKGKETVEQRSAGGAWRMEWEEGDGICVQGWDSDLNCEGHRRRPTATGPVCVSVFCVWLIYPVLHCICIACPWLD